MLVAFSIGISGCGDSDFILEEQGQRYLRDISFSDAEQDNIFTIDTVQDACAIDETTGEVTELGNLDRYLCNRFNHNFPKVRPGFRWKGYSINYIAIGSANSDSIVESPPDLVDIPDGYETWEIPSGSSSSLTIPILTVDTKDEFAIDMGWLDANNYGNWPGFPLAPTDLQVARYLIRLTLHFVDENGVDREISFR